MRRLFFFTCLFLVGLSSLTGQTSPDKKVHRLILDDVIVSPVVHEYIEEGIQRAEEEGAEALLIELDTPGGLLNSTRAIVKDIMNAKVPVIVYVAPSGSRAGSAGVFITLAAHVAAMASSTNIGAAHPVTVGGGKPKEKEENGIRELIRSLSKGKNKKEKNGEQREQEEATPAPTKEPMSEKVLNDTIAWVTAMTEKRGRNVDWAVRAVRESVSAPESEAVRKGVVDLVANNVEELLVKIDGRTVELPSGKRILKTAGATVIDQPLSARQQLLNILINPNIAYILMMIGFYGLLFEITHPGSWIPGIAGAICLILAMYAFHTIPTNYAGLGLIVLAVTLFIAEAFVPSYGLLTLGGVVCMSLGSLFLIDSPHEFMQVSLTVIVPIVAATAFLAIFLVSLAVRAQRQTTATGLEGMIGLQAIANDPIAPTGKIFVNGEYWDVSADESVATGETVEIVATKGMKLKVKKVSPT